MEISRTKLSHIELWEWEQMQTENTILEQTASLLAANIHLVKPYQDSITVENFYNNNEPITIPINTKISVNENINYYYDKYKKNKRAIRKYIITIKNRGYRLKSLIITKIGWQ